MAHLHAIIHRPAYKTAQPHAMPSPDLSALPTPPACTADFCLIPLGTATASVSREVAAVQRLLQSSGLHYSMHSAGTTLGESAHAGVRL